jgi:ACS family hexuronate transporter-like MFS transporter
MSLLVFAAKVQSFPLLIGLFAVSTFAYAAWSTMGLSLPSDLYPTRSVATMAGLGGTGAGVGTIISTFLIGQISDRYSFGPILVVASMVPLVATALVLVLVRQKKQGAIA